MRYKIGPVGEVKEYVVMDRLHELSLVFLYLRGVGLDTMRWDDVEESDEEPTHGDFVDWLISHRGDNGDFVEALYAIEYDISWLVRLHAEYSELFLTDRDAILEAFAKRFFEVVESSFRDQMYLYISRLCDRAYTETKVGKKSKKKSNMTLKYLKEVQPRDDTWVRGVLPSDIELSLDEIKNKYKKTLKVFRNTSLAHRDADTSLGIVAMSKPSMDEILEFVKLLKKHTNLCRRGYGLPERDFEGQYYEQESAGTLMLRIEEYLKLYKSGAMSTSGP